MGKMRNCLVRHFKIKKRFSLRLSVPSEKRPDKEKPNPQGGGRVRSEGQFRLGANLLL